MSNEAKEWVTIKIPEDIRDDAREDPRTYGDIMQAGLEHEPVDVDLDAIMNELSMASEPGVDIETGELVRELEAVRELVDRVPERTVERLEGHR